MPHRFLRSIVLCVLLALGATTMLAWAQEADTPASQLFEQFMDQYARGEYDSARATAQQIDPVQLPRDQRVTLYETIKQIDSKAVEASDPAALFERAGAASKAGDPVSASNTYKLILQHEDATDEDKRTARARLAELVRLSNMDRTRLRQMIDAAVSDVRADRHDEAEKKLTAVRASGVNVGWFDDQRIARHLALIDEHHQHVAEMERLAAEQAEAERLEAEQAEAERIAAEQAEAERLAAEQAEAERSAAEMAEAEAEALEALPAVPDTATTIAAEEPSTLPAEVEPEPVDWSVDQMPESMPATSAPATGAEDGVLAQTMKQHARELVIKAQQAEETENMQGAAQHYADALEQDATNADAKAGYERTKQFEPFAEGSLLEGTIIAESVRAQAVLAELGDRRKRAEDYRQQKNYEAALRELDEAKQLVKKNSHLLPPKRYEKELNDATSLAAVIEGEADEERRIRVEKDLIQKKDTQEEARRIATEELENTVNGQLRRANQFHKEQRYTEALSLVEQALFLDPHNPAAQLMHQVIDENRRQVESRRIMQQRNINIVQQSQDNLAATDPITELMQYPADWPQLSEARQSALETQGADSELNRRVHLKLEEHLDLPFENNEFANVIGFLRQSTGLNIFVNWPALETAGVERETPITLRLRNVPAEQALKLVLAQASAVLIDEELDFTIVDGILNISTESDLTRDTVVQVYDIRDLLAQVPDFDNAPDFDLNSALDNTSSGGSGTGTSGGGGNRGGGSRGGSSGGSGGSSIFGDSDDDDRDREDEEERRQQTIEDITTLIRETVGKAEDWAEFGGQISSLRELNGNLIAKTTPQNHTAILGLLANLRETRAIQIHVEGRFLLVDQNFLDEFGMDMDLRIPDVGSNFGPIRVAQDSFSLAARPSTGLPGGFLQSTGSGISLPLGVTGFGESGFDPRGRSLDFSMAYLDDLQLRLLITATQASRRSIVLTAPRLTFFNGQRAFIYVARQISFISDLEPVPDAGGFDPTLSVISSGVVLRVDGTVSADRRYVTLTVEPSLATVIQPIRTISQTGVVDIPGGDPNDPQQQQLISGFIEAPEIEITEVAATVSVPDKGTIIMGGQRLVGEIEVEAGVPILSKIPFANRFFTNRSKVKDERTLLILIKPTILIQQEEEDRLFPGLIQGANE